MELKNMLEYQELDRKVFLLEKKLRESDELKNANKVQAAFKQSQDAIVSLSSKAQQRLEAVVRLQEKYQRVVRELEELTLESDNIEGEKEADFYDKRLAEIDKTLEGLEKDIIAGGDDLKSISFAISHEQQQQQQLKNQFAAAKKKYDALKLSIQKEAYPYMQQMKPLKEGIDEKLMERYQRVRKNKKMPVLVPFTSGGGCGGCMMELSESEKGKLSANGICECPNCGRLVYKI